jgi:hypothetical protein
MTESCPSYFTAIEEHFRCARDTPLFRLTPMDWALVEAWQNGGIPLEAVLRGIDVTFEKWRRRPAQARIEMVNSLAYCGPAVTTEAQAISNAAVGAQGGTQNPFPIEQVRGFIIKNAASLRYAGHADLAASLEALDLDALYCDLERLEQHLNRIEKNLIAKLRAAASGELLREARCALERELKPYRGKMTADQVAMLEQQFLDRRLLEAAGLPRLSLFYL